MFAWLIDFLQSLGIKQPTGLGWLTVVGAFVVAALAAWLLIPHVRHFSLRVGWADAPNPRRLNKEPLPNAGGLAIYAAVMVALVLAYLLQTILKVDVQIQILAILLGGSLVIMAGFIDDQFGLPPWVRLAVQLLAALLLVAVGLRINVNVGPIGVDGKHAEVLALSIPLTVLWIVAITNAINLMDGVDGLATGVCFITAISLVAVSAQDATRAAASILLAALAGAALAFLRHNFPPSRIILGDSGAYFFGYVVAGSAIMGQLKVTTVFSLVPPSLFLLIPLLDTAQVIVRRLIRRQNPLSTPGKDHLHHWLLERGYSQRRTTIVLWTATLAADIVAMALQDHMTFLKVATTTGGIVVLLFLAVWKRRPLPASADSLAVASVASQSHVERTSTGTDSQSVAPGSPPDRLG